MVFHKGEIYLLGSEEVFKIYNNIISKVLKNNLRNDRTILIQKNIAGLFIIKGLNILVGILIVPITIEFLNPTKYGIWITLTSLVGWFSFFDIGLGNGLRNRFAEAIARDEHVLAKTYISTTYVILSIIMSIFFLSFCSANYFINWGVVLNTPEDPLLINSLKYLAIIVFGSFCLNFVFNIVTIILTADQQPAKSALIDLIGKTITLILIFLLTKIGGSSLLSFGLIYCLVSPVVLIIATFIVFRGKYKPYRPSLKTIDFNKSKDLFSLGLKFFYLQLSGILLYQTNNMIIIQLFGPDMVTPYNIAFKYFGILMMGFSIIIAPFWSAFTEAWTKKDILWIKNAMTKLLIIWFLFLIVGIAMLINSKFLLKIWVGNSVSIPFVISALTLIWVIVMVWNGIFSHFLNGVGKITMQIRIGIGAALINVPASIFLGRIFSIEGILTTNVFIAILQSFIVYRQYLKLINQNAIGIWNR